MMCVILKQLSKLSVLPVIYESILTHILPVMHLGILLKIPMWLRKSAKVGAWPWPILGGL